MNRNKAIDIARGISMLLVIAGHCQYVNSSFQVWLYSFHIPLFFFLSGVVFSYEKYPKFKDFLKNKIKKLFLPYMLLGIITIISKRVLDCILAKNFAINEMFNVGIFSDIKKLLIGHRLHENYYAFWFILTMIVAILLFYFIAKFADKKKKGNVILVGVSVATLLIQVIVSKYVKGFYWSIDLVPIAISFISLGYVFKKKEEYIKEHFLKFDYAFILLFASIVFTIINYKFFSMVDLFACNMGNFALFAIGAILGIWFTLIVSYKLKECKSLEYIGKNTFIYYFLHKKIAFTISGYVISKILSVTKISLSKDFMFWLYMFMACLILKVIAFIINKFCPQIVGKSKKETIKCS